MIDFNLVDVQEQSTLNSYLSSYEAIEKFKQAIFDAGLGAVEVIADGNLHRFATASDKRPKKSGWYVLYMDHIPCGSFGSWKDGVQENFIAIENKNPVYTATEKAIIEEAIANAKKARDQSKKELQNEAATKALDLWNKAEAVTAHDYLIKKQIKSDGLRQSGNILYIPIINSAGEIRNLQRIYKDGTKKFLFGGEISGLYSYIAGDTSTIYICEGFATGMSVAMATGSAVVVAFNSGNLLEAGRNIKNIIGNANFVIAGDNDLFTVINGLPTNVGYIAASEAAKELSAAFVYPEFKDLSTKPTDFNDLMILEGSEAVRQQVYVSDSGLKLHEWGVDIYAGEAPPVEWLVRDILPAHSPCLLAAAGGTGKGMLSLDLALSVAEQKKGLIDLNKPREWLGKEISKHGKVVILSAEDSKDSIHQRLESLDPTEERRKNSKDNLVIVPLPNAGGPITLVSQDGFGKVYKATPAFEGLKKQLRRIKDLRLINIDPLASFVGIDVNADPQAGAFVLGLFASLAEDLKCCVMVSHHMSKPPKGGINTADDARNAVRGSTALVDGVRLALAIWPTSDDKYNKIKKEIADIEKTDVFQYGVIKSNSAADMGVYTAIRAKSGVLEKHISTYKPVKEDTMHELIIEEIKKAAEQGRPFTKTRTNSLYSRREEIDERLRKLSKNKLEDALQELLENESLVTCNYKASIAKYLDVPNGPFAEGTGSIEPGHAKE